MKKILISSALAALMVAPSLGFEVYNADETKVDVYGSIRGYVGAGSNSSYQGQGQDTGYLFGLQDNSQFGVKFSSGKFKANIEFGAVEPSIAGQNQQNNRNVTSYRQFWGSYTTDFGTFLFGKTNTPTIDNGFTSDWVNNDNGGNGFGFIATGSRKIQFQYLIGGFALALVEDQLAAGRNGNADGQANQESPRIAVAYEIKDEKKKPFFKIAATYKYYNSGNIADGVPAGTNAYHGWVAVKPSFGNMFVSVMAHYGKNGHLYGEQRTNFSVGGYSHQEIAAGLDAQRVGARLEFGVNFTKEIGLVLGGGYTSTSKGSNQKDNTNVAGANPAGDNSGSISSYSAFIQLPYKVSKNFSFIPQVSYYETKAAKASAQIVNGGDKEAGLIAGARIRWDF
ncbi:porin [Helicobacter jaachi]|uniref:Porin n=1 Tax=Helicobacter jaachi TaxID=1677920 RepID=A0A4U8TBI3_9HELI|nr:porin [Helicobacter jaachi]TLD96558.1 porin [Helicobacter jaachi]